MRDKKMGVKTSVFTALLLLSFFLAGCNVPSINPPSDEQQLDDSLNQAQDTLNQPFPKASLGFENAPVDAWKKNGKKIKKYARQ